jgi:hypothetical protein
LLNVYFKKKNSLVYITKLIHGNSHIGVYDVKFHVSG